MCDRVTALVVFYKPLHYVEKYMDEEIKPEVATPDAPAAEPVATPEVPAAPEAPATEEAVA